jgi:hypothetical protein
VIEVHRRIFVMLAYVGQVRVCDISNAAICNSYS